MYSQVTMAREERLPGEGRVAIIRHNSWRPSLVPALAFTARPQRREMRVKSKAAREADHSALPLPHLAAHLPNVKLPIYV